jgi:hypothetical protein
VSGHWSIMARPAVRAGSPSPRRPPRFREQRRR